MLSTHIVLFKEVLIDVTGVERWRRTIPLAFVCKAKDGDHAEEQCHATYPSCVVVWVVETDDAEYAYRDYYNLPDDFFLSVSPKDISPQLKML